MKIALYDPLPMGNEYATKMFMAPMRAYAADNSIGWRQINRLTEADKGEHVLVLTDHLSEELILFLKNNGNKIVGLNVTDSSYISGAIRYAKSLQLVDLIFMVSGVQNRNEGFEIAVDDRLNTTLVPKPFLEDDAWSVFDYMRRAGRLQSLPYVPWQPIPEVAREPWARRSQKVILRGGGHARRFLLALHLLRLDKLDVNSGFVLHPYFEDGMNPQFKYCPECRMMYQAHRNRYPYIPKMGQHNCNGPHASDTAWSLDDLGQWNNRCPRSFYWMAEQFMERHGTVDMSVVETILGARWLDPKVHMERLGRITFTSDLKWVHSIYKPQRFWEAASAGCINVLPLRSIYQDYFPNTQPNLHYLGYEETFENLDLAFTIDEGSYREISEATRHFYETWIAPSRYGINTNLLTHIFDQMRKL